MCKSSKPNEQSILNFTMNPIIERQGGLKTFVTGRTTHSLDRSIGQHSKNTQSNINLISTSKHSAKTSIHKGCSDLQNTAET